MNTSFAQFNGPRLIRREELFASDQLFRICFEMPEADNEGELLANYAPPRRGGTFVMVHEGKPVSQISIFHDQLKVYDGTIQVGSIGGVCTHPDYRKQGLASRLMEHCTQQLVNEGARLMLISGDEGVYMRLGNVFQGKYMNFSINRDKTVNGGLRQMILLFVEQLPLMLCSAASCIRRNLFTLSAKNRISFMH